MGCLEGKVEAGKTVTHTDTADKLTEERGAPATIDFEGGEATIVMKANLWARPK